MAPGPIEELALLDLERSNKGASKQRRDQINGEIGTMRDLLPLPESARQRLSQLQIMSLSCVYIRKCNILQKMLPTNRCSIEVPCEFSSALTGFILVTTRDGKLVYISENVTEYLGHSMVDMKTQGDSLFDIVDKRDHGTVQAQLLHGVSAAEGHHNRKISFFCRMNMSRTLKRQGGFGDVKVMHVKGHFVPVSQKEAGVPEQHVFMALCTPLITPDVKESLIQNNTTVFRSVHKLDMSFIELTETGEFHLGITNEQIENKSWYSMLHPEDLTEARAKHIQLIKSRHEMGCMMTVRMLTHTNKVIWVNIVMHVRQALVSNSDDPVIVCINQVVSEEEAKQFKIQGQLFALYAARAPDIFFGGHHFQHFQQIIDPDMLGRHQTHAFMQQPHAQQGYYSDQQRYQFGTRPSPNEYQQQPQQHQKYGMPGLDEMSQQPPHGHTSTIKALKRKLQENFISSCKPNKIPRVMSSESPDGGFQDFTSGQTHYVMNVNVFRGSANDILGSGNGIPVYGGDSLPMIYQSAPIDHVQAIRQKKAMLVNAIAPVGTPAVVQKLAPTCTLEQVVPEVTIPDCYLTPDPSPANSPKPHSVVPVKQETQEIKQLTSYVMGRLNELKENQTIFETPVAKPINGVPNKKKNLPVIDATFVDSFFDDLRPIEKEGCIEIKMEPLSPEPTIQNAVGKQNAHSRIALQNGLIMTSQSPPPIVQPLPQRTCNVKEELTLEECTDLEELLGLVDTAGPETNMMSPAYSTESVSPVASPKSYTCSVSESSPVSRSFGSTPCLKQNSLDQMYTEMSPGSSSPGYEGRDDILEPDSWLLEPISMSLDMSLADIETMPCEVKTREEEDLFHLKKLLQQSWEPCGTQGFKSHKNTQ
ncbi:uncharacterized protein LOC132730083 [Ruditapes philippinarum]|uniref:uncharacterized protein LOC132730083 n=1 Tax=Ruditapes philippinarum TaxID=129788 RepID=UPI00295B153B|nr:uncharacterized protein LOC132730083 [Ruditapes philippinarum]